jgi:C1A family cysteine protease
MDLHQRQIEGMGWKPDLPDPRDRLFAAPPALTLPPYVGLKPGVSAVFDQGQLGSCTANAIAALVRFVERKQGEHSVALSRLFIYWYERYLEGSVDYDSGAYLRDGLKVVGSQGAPPESMWPYDISKFRDKPPIDLNDDALHHEALSYMRVSRTLTALKSCLASGYPFVFGFSVFESFMKIGADGLGKMPASGEELLGGHAVLATGYDNRLYGGSGGWWVLNSWGKSWGHYGWFALPYAYLLDSGLSNDFWTIRRVS